MNYNIHAQKARVLSDAASNRTHRSRHSTINREANSFSSGYIPSPLHYCQLQSLKTQPFGLANTILVPSATRHVDSPTSASSSGSQAFDQPSGGPLPASSEQNPVSSRMACIQQSVSTRGISDRAYKLILASWRPGTNTVYNSAWSKWYSWCEKGKLIHFPPT